MYFTACKRPTGRPDRQNDKPSLSQWVVVHMSIRSGGADILPARNPCYAIAGQPEMPLPPSLCPEIFPFPKAFFETAAPAMPPLRLPSELTTPCAVLP